MASGDFHPYGPKNIIEVNPALKQVLTVINPLAAIVDVALFGSIGLGGLEDDLALRLKAAVQAELDLGLQIGNPTLAVQLLLQAIANLSFQIPFAFNPHINVSADLEFRIGALRAMINGMLDLKIPAASLLADIEAKLSVGPVFGLAWEDQETKNIYYEIDKVVAEHLYTPTDTNPKTYGILIMTKSPEVFSKIMFAFNWGD